MLPSGVRLVFSDEHSHVDHSRSLRFQMHGQRVFAGAIAVIERSDDVLWSISRIPEAEHGVVAVGHAPVVGKLAARGTDSLRFDFEDVGAGLVDAAGVEEQVASFARE